METFKYRGRKGMRLALYIILYLLYIHIPTVEAKQPAQPVKVEFGVTTVGLNDNETKTLFGKLLSEMDIRWVRVVRLDWDRFEPAPPKNGIPQYQWQRFDKIIRSLQKAIKKNTNVVLLVHPTSRWAADRQRYKKARSGRKITNTPPRPENIKHWQRALEDLFDRYNHDGKNDMPGLKRPFKHWQIGNEYMGSRFWDGTVEEYIQVLRAAYMAKQKIDPSVEIILGGFQRLSRIARYDSGDYRGLGPGFTSKRRLQRLEQMTRFTKEILKYPQFFDFIDVHIFNNFRLDPDVIPDAINWLKGQMSLNGYSKPYGALEWTASMTYKDAPNRKVRAEYRKTIEILISNPSHPDYERIRKSFEMEQANDFAKVFVTMIGYGLERNIYVQFRDLPRKWRAPRWAKQGLMGARTRGGRIEGPKPVYFVYKNLLKKLSGSIDKIERLFIKDGIYAWKFISGNEVMVVIWSEEGDQEVDLQEIAVAQPGQLRTFDLISGEKELVTGKIIRITSSPVMILK